MKVKLLNILLLCFSLPLLAQPNKENGTISVNDIATIDAYDNATARKAITISQKVSILSDMTIADGVELIFVGDGHFDLDTFDLILECPYRASDRSHVFRGTGKVTLQNVSDKVPIQHYGGKEGAFGWQNAIAARRFILSNAGTAYQTPDLYYPAGSYESHCIIDDSVATQWNNLVDWRYIGFVGDGEKKSRVYMPSGSNRPLLDLSITDGAPNGAWFESRFEKIMFDGNRSNGTSMPYLVKFGTGNNYRNIIDNVQFREAPGICLWMNGGQMYDIRQLSCIQSDTGLVIANVYGVNINQLDIEANDGIGMLIEGKTGRFDNLGININNLYSESTTATDVVIKNASGIKIHSTVPSTDVVLRSDSTFRCSENTFVGFSTIDIGPGVENNHFISEDTESDKHEVIGADIDIDANYFESHTPYGWNYLTGNDTTASNLRSVATYANIPGETDSIVYGKSNVLDPVFYGYLGNGLRQFVTDTTISGTKTKPSVRLAGINAPADTVWAYLVLNVLENPQNGWFSFAYQDLDSTKFYRHNTRSFHALGVNFRAKLQKGVHFLKIPAVFQYAKPNLRMNIGISETRSVWTIENALFSTEDDLQLIYFDASGNYRGSFGNPQIPFASLPTNLGRGGVTTYDSTNNRIALWNGSNWVFPDGTAIP